MDPREDSPLDQYLADSREALSESSRIWNSRGRGNGYCVDSQWLRAEMNKVGYVMLFAPMVLRMVQETLTQLSPVLKRAGPKARAARSS